MNGITNDRQVCLTVGADHRLELGDRARRRCRECRCRSSPSARRPRSMAGVSTEACRTYLPSPRAMYSPFWCRRPGLDRPDTIRGPWPGIPDQGRSRIRPAGGRCPAAGRVQAHRQSLPCTGHRALRGPGVIAVAETSYPPWTPDRLRPDGDRPATRLAI